MTQSSLARCRVEHIMGMPIEIDLRDEEADPAALDRAFDWFRWVDATFSTYRSDSEIMRLNRGDLLLEDTHPDVQAVLARCEELRIETDGYFNIQAAFLYQWDRAGDFALRIGAVDPSGLVKGWSIDRAATILEEAGAMNYCINAGGDIRLHGHPASQTAWRVGIQHPLQRDKIAAIIAATDLAVATSGAYERGLHIINPHTGCPPEGILSVTFVGPDLATTDAYATAAYAMGQDAPAWTARLVRSGYGAMTILETGTVLSTPGFPVVRDE